MQAPATPTGESVRMRTQMYTTAAGSASAPKYFKTKLWLHHPMWADQAIFVVLMLFVILPLACHRTVHRMNLLRSTMFENNASAPPLLRLPTRYEAGSLCFLPYVPDCSLIRSMLLSRKRDDDSWHLSNAAGAVGLPLWSYSTCTVLEY